MSTPRDPGEHAPALAAALGSLALSAIVLLRRPLLNNDGVFYLLAADTYARDGLAAARAVHGWPFHAILIAWVAALLHISTDTAAHLAGAILLAAASAAFVAVVRALGGDRRVQWLAAAVILAHPWLNRSRALVVRDGGEWAFGLLALVMLLRLDGPRRAASGLRWAASSVAAALFRPDAIALMAAAPVAAAFRGDASRRDRAVLALAVLLPTIALALWTRHWLAADPSFDVSPAPFRAAATALAAGFPLPYGREYAPVILAVGLAAVPVLKTLKAAGLVHLALAAVGFVRGGPTRRFDRAALFATLAAAMLPLYVQVARLLFVESRYTVFATLVLALWAPFGLAWLLRREAGLASRIAGGLLAAGLAVTLVAELPLHETRGDAVRAAAAWVRARAPAHLHTNSLQVAYLSGAPVDWRLVRYATVNGAVDGFESGKGDLWAVRVAPGDGALRARLDGMRLFARSAAFEGPDGDAVLVYTCTGAARCVSGY